MRHTCISYLANTPGVPLTHVMKFAGHKDIQTTMRYVHTKPQDVARTLEHVDFAGLGMECEQVQSSHVAAI